MSPDNPSRRLLVGSLTLATLAVAPIHRIAHAAASAASGLPHLTETDPAAKALTYVEDAAQATTLPGFVEGSRCDNCLQLQGNAGDPFRPCPLFAGKLVSAAGWCKSWTPEM